MSDFILETRGIVKIFPGVRALDGVDLKIKKGEVHAIVGENGAGKSTLMLTLGGIHRPDEGEIYLEGEKVLFSSAQDALKKGISIVHQELSLVPNLSVAENIYANRQPVNRLSLIKKDELYQMTREMLSLFEIDNILPSTLVKDLSIANQQVVEILKAMSFHPKVLILDEPTSSLTEIEKERLFKNMRVLKEKGISFIYISHHLQEIFQIADRITILRDGAYICEADVADIDEDFLITNMVGRKIENIYGRRQSGHKIGKEILEVKNISRSRCFKNISFSIKAGEIVGFSGLVGAGRTEIGRAIFGAEPIQSGEIYLDGKKRNIKSPEEAIAMGIGYMSEDRKQEGLYIDFSIKANLIANRLRSFTSKGFLKEKNIDSIAADAVKAFNVATPGIEQKVGNLSGGNQQKVLLAAWFGIKPKILIVDEPTRGVDVGAKSEIYTLLRNLAASGVGIIMISSDLPEILGVSDRIIVVRQGEIAGELPAEQATEENIISMASGVDVKAEAQTR
ncbi:sugar ABC transporter ATP-binding protein [uncultured Robinsoniella sp.]|uniref:sugar ABC transporter ATP-binding protein n=1 Tax=uncultured Robinsoniella sp. TaxID=904190 RepID=UPI00374E9591